MTESNDQSYYEIALTNRQAIFFFVFLLVFVLLVFLSGVWVGRSGQKEMLEKARLEAAASASQIELAGIPEVQIGPGGRAGEEPASPPDLSSLEPPRPAGPTTLAQDVGAGGGETGAPENEPAPAEPAPVEPEPPPVQPAPAPVRAAPETAVPEPAPAASAPAASGSFVIQVFSTKDESQAKKVHADLQKAGFKAFMSPVKIGSSTNFRVRIGPFAQRSQADQTAVKVKEKFRRFDTWVTAASN